MGVVAVVPARRREQHRRRGEHRFQRDRRHPALTEYRTSPVPQARLWAWLDVNADDLPCSGFNRVFHLVHRVFHRRRLTGVTKDTPTL